MAEAILAAMFPGKYYVRSAGIETKDIDGFTVSLLKQRHIDISNHVPKKLSDLHDSSFDIIVALTEPAYDAAKQWAKLNAAEVIRWSITEPVYFQKREETLQAFETIYQELYQAIEKEFS